MRFLPRSLYGRLVLVLLVGLAVAQLFSLAIHMSERGALLQQASGRQLAQRIADAVRLLDAADPAGRRQIVRVLSAAPLRVSLERGRLAEPASAGAEAAEAAEFGALLRAFLGEGWPWRRSSPTPLRPRCRAAMGREMVFEAACTAPWADRKAAA